VYRFCHGSVDTPIDGVDTGSESLKVFHEDRVKCVDTAPGSVDTSPRFQKTQLPDWDSCVDTLPGGVDTLRLKLKNVNFSGHVAAWELRDLTKVSVPMHPKALYGHMGLYIPMFLVPHRKRAHTLPEEAFWRPKGAFQILLHLQKLQAILSRGRTWESRGISGEKLVVLGKGADPIEEAQEKKDF
ncbi:hypothetical protein Taro_043495, partial [Colocasia esculenta]|nr:hypothetical protein [Colocasia esculenta]